ncbi:ABC-type amino acid transport system permease subunit [Paenarthrobacter nicotinovorans]|uniref:ABC-type amino acid transport system permease subunit n=1 Tax=Paenarthrobacter nicotinovorans TaxID=29320 RepID=A0ABT9TN81_PAENI|nr:hypothetical protein [Paenarthrobacter nicotinovorans]MDQ0103133.1 ABC-type amino acid transport system permease subunit [Paenarthrobacter nicotinovorans]GAT88461.1 hypothetical protein CVCC1112_3120 [Paenarthrobacter nicotinovorans]
MSSKKAHWALSSATANSCATDESPWTTQAPSTPSPVYITIALLYLSINILLSKIAREIQRRNSRETTS